VASGLKSARPDLSVWVVSGDGDGLSIGGNHLIHMLRRNFDLNILMFNNQIYGLTKGQYSPTSEEGKVTKSTPMGSVDHPFNPIALALGAEGTFIARSMDRDPAHLKEMLRRSYKHKGTSFLEIYQNCNVFNDGAFFIYTEKDTKKEETLFVEHGKPLVFGPEGEKGVKLDGFKPVIVNLKDGSASPDDLWVHDERDRVKSGILSRFFDNPALAGHFPRPFGVFYVEDRFCYEDALNEQIQAAVAKKGEGDIDALLRGREVWEIH
jgi:2-oxoglutarate ferredoxin oxidoreductase subunit beta